MAGAGAAIAAAILVAVPAAGAAAELSLTTGAGYTTGGYGSTRSTQTAIVPFAARLRAGGWTFGISTQWASVDGPGDLSEVDGDGVVHSSPGQGKRDRQGFTDTFLSARYAFNHIGGGPLYLDLQGKAAVSWSGDGGVSSSRDIVDAELGADWRGGGVYVDFGRRFMSDTAAVQRRDAWAYAAGGWARFDRRTEFGMWYVAHDPVVAGQAGARKLGAYVSRDLSRSLRAHLSVYEGLSPASPDLGVGLRLSWKPGLDFRRRPFE